MYRLPADIYLDGWRAVFLSRQTPSKSAETLQRLQKGKKQTACRDRTRSITRQTAANRGSGQMRELRMLDHRSILSVTRTTGLLPGVFPPIEWPFIKRNARRVLTSDVNARPKFRIGLGLTQDLARDRCSISFAEQNVSRKVHDRITFGPSKIDVRYLPLFITKI